VHTVTTNAVASGQSADAPRPRQFTRASSGLVREFSIGDAASYGVISAGATVGFLVLFPFPQASSPGIWVFGTCALAFLVALPIYFVYAGLGSAMPRAGGDYVYESRSLNPFVGFVVPMTCQVLAFLPLIVSSALVAAQSGLAPIASAIGWDGLASDLTTKSGSLIATLVLIALMYIVNVRGLRVYKFVQRYLLIPAIALSAITVYIVLLTNLNTDFAADFDSYSAPLTTAEVEKGAQAAGFEHTGYSLGDTALWVTPLLAYVPFAMFAAMGLLGEVRSANNFGKLFRAFVIPGFIVAFVLLGLPYLLLQSIIGSDFLGEFGTAYVAGEIAPNYVASVQVLLAMLADSPVVTTLIALGFIAAGFGFANSVFVNCSRIMMAMGLERALPPLFGDVSSRFHTPVKGLTIYAVASAAVAWVYIYDPDYALTLLISTTVLSAVILAVTSLGGALLPYRAPAIYRESPVARYTLGSVPAITVVGAIGAIVVSVFVYLALTEDALGLTSTDARITMAAEFGIAALIFGVNRLLQRSRGFDPSLAAREIPPD
jgi:basic amino acid/polyamine antiporter, APA family